MQDRTIFIASAVGCLVALSFGCFLLMVWGGETPTWMLSSELAAVCSVALVYGFTALLPSLAPWLWSRPVKGAACVCLGVAAIFVPLSFVVAAILIALGTRLMWTAAVELEGGHEQPVVVEATPRPVEAKARNRSVPHVDVEDVLRQVEANGRKLASRGKE
ncbi:hypothetical protein [Paludisphaera borealis]|uniref:hypothetical protein n=1 Tax=Paludisphaera borealis TaxID=1387353 RepID=UPI00097110EB|nr:hypothetical protein [Paludisphaera borealis]